MTQSIQSQQEVKPLRLLPGIITIVLMFLVRFVVPTIWPATMMYSMLAVPLGLLSIIVWWAFFSRAPKFERWSFIVIMILSLLITRFFLHQSIAQGGYGILYIVYAVPGLCLAFVIWAIVTRHMTNKTRRITMVIAIALASLAWIPFRYEGITAAGDADFTLRWNKSVEEQLVSQINDGSASILSNQPILNTDVLNTTELSTEAEWPGFRGPTRDGIVHNVKIETNWSTSPPVELWRRPVGPGWSSFSVHGDRIYTQEQRGEEEVVSCYQLSTGKPVWFHGDSTRFWEAQGGAGPRGTPTLHGQNVYALGATGIFKVLNATDGTLVWSRNAAKDTNTKTPMWGYSASPWIYEDLVIIGVSGALIAYDLESGEPRWLNFEEGECHCSPQLFNIDGIDQILFQNPTGTISVNPLDGTLYWKDEWSDFPIVQPAMAANGDIYTSTGEGAGIRRLSIKHTDEGWTPEAHWTSKKLKPYFNDSAIHEEHIYGFFGPSLGCMKVEDGSRLWKGGKYGRGQFILLADQDLIIVLSEKGDLALVNAVPDKFTELANIPAIKGKTWNHPVLIGDILLVRNGQEMAAFQLSHLED